MLNYINYLKHKQIIEEVNKIFFSFKEIVPSNSDCILVLGCKDGDYRMLKAIEIYNQKNMPIFVSGGNINIHDKIESSYFKGLGIKNGINEENIIEENLSRNTIENIEYSIPLIIKKINKKNINIILVTSSYHLPRTYQLWLKYKKNNNLNNINVIPFPSYGANMRPNKWFLRKDCVDKIINELDTISNILKGK